MLSGPKQTDCSRFQLFLMVVISNQIESGSSTICPYSHRSIHTLVVLCYYARRRCARHAGNVRSAKGRQVTFGDTLRTFGLQGGGRCAQRKLPAGVGTHQLRWPNIGGGRSTTCQLNGAECAMATVRKARVCQDCCG